MIGAGELRSPELPAEMGRKRKEGRERGDKGGRKEGSRETKGGGKKRCLLRTGQGERPART